ncbi:CheY-like superfamily [Metarhizium album ARSEF 1941]|uniref:CheY-like superfamily n=1 Tax=Metarhizium album (strain ARSEF 1941) TaxID=1081103 RepID=A0A0B2X4M7_METAS|nr:CheY-like superfamily [Metarhizium album ARSEF 1941]KHO00405.1 CheY-like superfamily [Metarhizium album ARSEF 1941]
MQKTLLPARGSSKQAVADCGEMGLDSFWDVSPVPTLVVSPTHRIRKASQSIASRWDRDVNDLVGNNVFVVLYGGSPLERFDRIPLASAIENAVAGRALALCPNAYHQGAVSWSARIVPIFKGEQLQFLVLEFDTDEHRHAKVSGIDGYLCDRMVDDMFRLLVDTVKDYAIFLLDTRGYVATWNAGAELLKGFQREDIVGRHFSTFYGQADLRAGKPEKELMTCLRQGRVEDEGWRYRKDGSRFWANVVITALYRNGVHIGFGKVTRDLTERRESELRLIDAYEESSKLKNDFLANVSHEIRTPMHGLLSACSLLLDTNLSEDQRETANIIAESGQVLLGVINSILDYSKLASGTFSITSDVFGVGDVVASVIRTARTTVVPGVHIKLHLAPNLPRRVRGDQLRFRQIMQNIIDNAAKFTSAGYISVSCSVREETDTAYSILTEVADSGIGVKTSDAKKLFQPFMQSEVSIKKRFQGTGLGLSIAKSLAVLMGGDLGYRPNSECRGSVFWFAVRLDKAAAAAAAAATTASEPQEAADKTPLPAMAGNKNSAAVLDRLKEVGATTRILVAEDNIINQKVLVGMLQSFGLKNIAVAPDGAQAVSALTGSPDKFDLVMMDVSMPVMDGFEATAHIRRLGSHVPILAMTANALRGYKEKCMQSGMDDYVPKPVSRNLLLQKLLLWLDPMKQHAVESSMAMAMDLLEAPPMPPSEPSTSQVCSGG